MLFVLNTLNLNFSFNGISVLDKEQHGEYSCLLQMTLKKK